MKMYINRVEIFGYGKWSKVRMDFHHQLQIFQGKNESGKSTLRSFIQHILFGFPKKVSGKYSYEPQNGGIMGGRIWLDETLEGSLFIERYIKMVSNVLNVKRLQEKVYPKIDGNN